MFVRYLKIYQPQTYCQIYVAPTKSHTHKNKCFFTVFTENQLDTLNDVLSKLSYADVISVNGLTYQIDQTEAMVYDPSFRYNSKIIGYIN